MTAGASLVLLMGLTGCGGADNTAPASSQAPATTPAASGASSADASALAAQLTPADASTLSDPASPRATLVVFTNYQCPYCATMDQQLHRAAQDYGDDLRIVVRNFPLPQHRNAPLAAQAAEAAGEQSAFSQMAGLIFERQSEWASMESGLEEVFAGYAQQLGLDQAQFTTDLNSQKIRDRVQRDMQTANELGVRGTPTLVLNNELLQVDSSDYAALQQSIEQALAN
ncbi:thioredoxin domain-containing protein [Acaricomes phytoseiuli]|uniref:DsbA family protein n=1 Tax=Acaricomes phytoseiuli TaxID=291968 RepID=UPI00037723B8|nr:thioredoxin domain-containing protein [Acaricomes phytoseiuli]MCW1249478.1 thioredoxin domain-containing protein [Acaricomes phytoseiuli]